jgi:pimeloyl-ACP methyl ester carboxylesterase
MRRFCMVLVDAVLFAATLTLAGLQPRAGTAPSGGVQASPAPQDLRWAACSDVPDAECAGLDVPVDPARRDGAQFTLRLARLPALGPAQRKGMLLFIPGGPGVGISDFFGEDLRRKRHIDEFRRQWDVVTFDPRGIRQSSPIRCSPDAVPPVIAPFDRPPPPAEYEAMARAIASFIQSCVEGTGELFTHLSSMDTAADIERIRQALSPNDGLVANGASYGTAYGAAYLERYGDHVQALVLDAVVDHSINLATELATRQLPAVQDAFDRMAQWCGVDPTCALHGEDVGSAFDAAVAVVPAVRTVVPLLLAAGRDPQLGWPAITQMIARARDGDPAALAVLTGGAAEGRPADDPSLLAGKDGLFTGVYCGDYGPQDDYAALRAAGEAIALKAPRFAWRFWDATPSAHGTVGIGVCAGWPLEARNPPHRLQVGSHPNVMVANPTHDPSTALSGALAVYLQIPEARLLIADVDGHEALVLSRCAFEAELRFLNDPTSVSTTTPCPD